jgi:CheY-like chemotaxis protein
VRVVVVHHEPAEAAELAARLRLEGIDAIPCLQLGSKALRELRINPPDAILIDLMRMPSYGRGMAILLREHKSTRAIPLVFLEGDPDKTARVRELLPDAGFAPLRRIGAALRQVVSKAPANPVVPQVQKRVAEKLRIKKGARISIVRAPENFQAILGPLPEGASVRVNSRDGDVILLFAKSVAALGRDLPSFANLLPGCSLWVLWPKRSSRVPSDISFPRINELCAPLGLVAYQTCAVDERWSAVAVSRRRR